jgi:hypothetical protein
VVTTLAGIYRLKNGGDATVDPDNDNGTNWELAPTRAQVDAKANQATTYTETEVDGLLDDKANISGQAFSGNISAPNLSGTNTGDQDLSGKADKATTYTKTESVEQFNQFGVGAAGSSLANADNAVLGSNNATGFDDSTAAVSGNYPDVGAGFGPFWWNLVTYGTSTRTTQVATEVFGLGGRPKGETFTRIKHDTWGPWVNNFTGGGAITASATFTNSTNNIALTGIGSIGLEIGDVVQVTGTASNNKLFTVEVITDSGNVIVNQAHAGGTTSKSLVNETVSATVTLVAKWFNAPIGLGQGWVAPSRSPGVTYTNNTLRAMSVNVQAPTDNPQPFTIDGLIIGLNSGGNVRTQWNPIIPPESTYSFAMAPTNLEEWTELR